MSTIKSFTVYKNLVLMLKKYRGYKVTSKEMDQKEFINEINMRSFCVIDGENEARQHDPRIRVVIVAQGSKYDNKTEDFKSLYIANTKESDRHMMFVFMGDRISPHIQKFLHPTGSEFYMYNMFLFEVPAHVSVPRHEIMDEVEVEKFCDINCTDRKKFPAIKSTDPQVVWIGGKPGQVIKIMRESDTIGVGESYRYCILDEAAA